MKQKLLMKKQPMLLREIIETEFGYLINRNDNE